MGLYDRLTSGKGIDYENQYTLSQQKAITYIPLVTSILSIIGSIAICYIILSDRKRKLSKVKQRLIFCMSILDIICSVWFGLWALPIPAGTPGVYGAHGNQQTCSAQGFFIQWQISVPMYNGALSVYYYLVVVRKKKNEEIAKKYELWLHLICNAYPFLSGIAAFFIDGGLYNYDSIGCWIAPYPRGCKHDKDLTCTRGNWAYVFQWLFAGIEEASAALIVAYCMWFVYKEVKVAEETMRKRYSFRQGSISDSRSLAETSRNTLYQALSYVFAVVATRLWSFVVVMNDEFGGANPFWVVVLQQFWFPLQGFWNAAIYIHPYYKKIRQHEIEAPWYWCVKEAILNAPSDEDMRRRRDSGSFSYKPRRRFSTSDTSSSSRRRSSSLNSLRNSLTRSLRRYSFESPKNSQKDMRQWQQHYSDKWTDNPQRTAATSVGEATGMTNKSSFASINTASMHETSLMTAEKKIENKKERKSVKFDGLPDENVNEGKESHEIRVDFISSHIEDSDSEESDSDDTNSDESIEVIEPAPVATNDGPSQTASSSTDVQINTMDEEDADEDIGEFEDEHILRHQLGELAMAQKIENTTDPENGNS